MKQLNLNRLLFGIIFLSLFSPLTSNSQEEKPSLSIDIRYFNQDNKLPYVLINTKLKVEKRFRPVKDVPLRVYLNDASDEKNLLGKFKTDEQGCAKAVLPLGVQEAWKASEQHTFIAIADATTSWEESESTLDIRKGKIIVDTAFDGETRSILVTVLQFQNGEWLPMPEAEVKVGVQRLGGVLAVNETESFTADSSGQITAEFSRLNLPGSQKGDLVLVAQIEDHDPLGNISATMSVPWGVPAVQEKDFFQRALWGSRFKSPLWLVVMAYSIIGTVWGVLIYLVFQLFKIKKLGKNDDDLFYDSPEFRPKLQSSARGTEEAINS